MADLDARYAQWRATADGAKVVGYVLDKARMLRERGWRHYGVAALVEVARYDRALEVGPDTDGLKINNSFRAYIAREVMESDDRLAGFFEVRRSSADEAAIDATVKAALVEGGTAEYLRRVDAEITRVFDHLRAEDITAAADALSAAPYLPGLAPVTVDQVPTARVWRCVQPGCARTVTREHDTHLQPALGGYLAGQCPNRGCWSNNGPNRKDRGSTMFAPIKEAPAR